MQRQIAILTAAALAAVMPFAALATSVGEFRAPVVLAMMDMMPMGGGGAMPGMPATPGAQPAPPAGGMGDDRMRMGGAMPGMPATPGAQPAPPAGGMGDDMMRMGGGMPAQGQTQAPTGQMPQPQAAGMCPMCAMMQNMMRMGTAQPGMTPPMSGGPAAGAGMARGPAASPVEDSVPRLEGRIAYLRSALRITEPQAAGWDAFAAALRTGRGHLDAARNALEGANAAADPMARLESYEGHLAARMEAIRTTRLAFNALYGQLDEAQKRAATTTMLPFIGAF